MQTPKSTHQRKQELELILAWLVEKIVSYAPIDASEVDISKSFATYGLSSTDAVSLSGELEEWLDRQLPPTLLYHYPTIELLAHALLDEPDTIPDTISDTMPDMTPHTMPLPQTQPLADQAVTTRDIAIIGMAGRFPGASDVDTFWQNLRAGLETITVFRPEELIAAGGKAETINRPDYICARPVLKAEEVECFDAAFFGYSPHEAAITDPQHRLFLECAWEAMERAGYAPGSSDDLVGVYAGCSLSTYLLALAATEHIRQIDDYQIVIGHDKDSLTSTVSYKLDLKGPSFAVQTFCSTSLVAVHLACQSLLVGECDLALAGGVSVHVPSTTGYRYYEGGMESHDGHCRAFDSAATGTLFGDGAGIVVLKRLQDALRDGDTIDAVIKGSAINNDGLIKMSYTAPSIVGQSAAITKALTLSGVDASTLGYVEAHGSATELGDPIEVAALTKAFHQQTTLRNYCGLGSVKTNIGHLDRAAGVAGLIKVAQALKHQEIPPTLHIQTPNPKLALEHSPFFLTTDLMPWPNEHGPRRASVNSLGLGGTNAHVILEEAPERPDTSPSRPWQLLMLSARTETALETATQRLQHYLQEHEHVSLADIAYTLQVGRKRFEYRRYLLCRDHQDALRLLATPSSPRVLDHVQQRADCQIFFLFPDTNEHLLHITHALYQQEPYFRHIVDDCCQILYPLLDLDLRTRLYPDAQSLTTPELAQPALFVIEYALARLLMHWGIQPHAMLGYRLGESIAATLAGVFSLEDALTLVTYRAQLSATPCYGTMNEPLKKQFRRLIPELRLHPPSIPTLSNLTGTWLTDEQATSPEYWAEQMCETPHFADSVGSLLPTTPHFADSVGSLLPKMPHLLIEIGIGQTLGALVKQHRAYEEELTKIVTLQPACRTEESYAFFLTSIGQIWLDGTELHWKHFYDRELRRRVPLPTYPFERQRYWIDVQDWRERPPVLTSKANPFLASERKADMTKWFSVPSWKQAPPLQHTENAAPASWLIFLDEAGLGEALAQRLLAQGQQVVTVTPNSTFATREATHYQINPRRPLDYRRLLQALVNQRLLPTRILHGWSLTTATSAQSSSVEQRLDTGFYSLLALAQAIGEFELDHCTLSILANGIYDVLGHETISPEKATILGPCHVIPQEYQTLHCHLIEIALPDLRSPISQELLVEQLLHEVSISPTEKIVALRGLRRWLPTFEEIPIPEPAQSQSGLRERGVYLITGGLGGIGLAIADHLARTIHARLALTSREELPPRNDWPHLLHSAAKDCPTRQRIAAILAMEQQGAEVLIMAADVANQAQMRHVIDQTRATFGALNGVLHLAGVPGAGLIQLKTPEQAAAVLAPKVQGTLVLDRLLQDVPLDFLLLFSSITSATGGPGQVDYSAANAFLDAYARSQGHNFPVCTIAWSEWQWNAWSDGLAGYDESMRTFFEENRRTFGLSFSEGIAALERILTRSFPQVLVSTQDIQALVELSHSFTINAPLQSQQPKEEQHARPPLKNSYSAPRNDDERKMVRIWEELLAIKGIGIYDNFFDLGGNSLLGVNLLLQVRKAFHLEQLPAYVLYEAPCVEAITHYLTQDRQTLLLNALDERSSKRQSLLKKRMREKTA